MKKTVKSMLFVGCAIVMLPMVLMFHLFGLVLDKNQLIAGFSQLLSLLPGKLGSYLRAGFYRFVLNDCAPNVLVGFGTLLSHTDTDLGKGSYIGPQCNLGMCSIGKNTLLGSGVHVLSGKEQHNFSDTDKPIKAQGGTFTKISIGDNCWIGNTAVVMANVGSGSVVAAGAVVVDAIPDNAIAVGNPAKVVKYRGK
jgi:virginiamycin A acetyltransferase